MTDVAYPVVYAGLMSLATAALTTVRVVDSDDVSDDPGDVLIFGVRDFFDPNPLADAGRFDQSMNTFSTVAPRMEEGSINAVLLAWVGDSDLGSAAVARAKAFGYIDTLASALRTTPKLGISTLSDVVAQLSAGQIAEGKVDGATCVVPLTVAYKAFL